MRSNPSVWSVLWSEHSGVGEKQRGRGKGEGLNLPPRGEGRREGGQSKEEERREEGGLFFSQCTNCAMKTVDSVVLNLLSVL